jgi:hypothetical protein
MYLAGGVTTIRTAGAIEPSTDLRLKRQIDKGWVVGPKIHVTGPNMQQSNRDFSIPLRVRHSTIFSQRSVVACASLFLATSRNVLYAFNFHSFVG